MTLAGARRFAFVVMILTAFVGIQTRVLAGVADPFTYFCMDWYDWYHCSVCSASPGDPEFEANGSCDFSSIEDEQDRLLVAGDYLAAANDACFFTCDSDYEEYVADWYYTNANPFDPCYSAWARPDNWVVWDQFDPGNGAGAYTEWECTCGIFFWGECE